MVFINNHLRNYGGIYCILNTITGKIYIGSTIRFQHRFTGHLNSLLRGEHHSITLQRSFDKYNRSAFHFYCLEVIENKESLRSREQEYLDCLKPYLPSIGYNRSESAFGTDSSDNIQTYREKLGRRVVAYDLEGNLVRTFISITEASEHFKYKCPHGILLNCQGKVNRCHSNMFRFVEEDGSYSQSIPPYKDPRVGADRGDVGRRISQTRRQNGSYKPLSIEHKAKFSRKGRKHSLERKALLSITTAFRHLSPESRAKSDRSRQKRVIAYDWLGYPIREYESLKMCAFSHNITSGTMSSYIGNKPYRDEFLVYLPKERVKIKGL